MTAPVIKKHAIRFLHHGNSRTYVLNATDTIDAICAALDLLECDVPAITDCQGLAVIAKPWPEGAHLALEGDGPVIDLTRTPLTLVDSTEQVAA